MIWPIAVITFKEGTRSRALFAILIFALVFCVFALVFIGFFMRDVVKVAIDVTLSGTAAAGLLLTLFVCNQLVAKDLDKRTIQMVLSRSISRPVYIVGKFVGMVLLIVAAMALIGLLAGGTAWLADAMTDEPYGTVYWGSFAMAVVATTLMLVIVAAVGLLFSSITSNSFLALGLSALVYVIGQSTDDIRAFVSSGAEGVTISPAVAWVVKVVYYVVPNLGAYDLKMVAAHGLDVPLTRLVWLVVYAVCVVSALVAAAAMMFRRREFP